MLDGIKDIRDQIEATLRLAWTFDATDRVIYGRPPGDESENYPVAIIRLDSVPRAFNGVRSVTETMAFEIEGHFEKQNGEILEDVKLEKARAGGEALLSASWSALGGYMPQITGVTFAEDELSDAFYGVGLRFEILTDIAQ